MSDEDEKIIITVKRQSDFAFQNGFCDQNKAVLFPIITIMHVWCFSPTTCVKNAKELIEACICTSNSSFPKVEDNKC